MKFYLFKMFNAKSNITSVENIYTNYMAEQELPFGDMEFYLLFLKMRSLYTGYNIEDGLGLFIKLIK